MSEKRNGGCLCGAIRYDMTWPPATAVACHCKDCQRQAGSVLSVVAVIPKEGFVITQGRLKTFSGKGDSGRTVLRKFCGDCGSPILSELPDGPFEVMRFIKVGTLDDTSGLKPTTHIWTKSAQAWFEFPHGVQIKEAGLGS